MRADRLAQLRQETVDMFYHGYSNYMQHAFPEDELRPLSCAPLTRDRDDPTRIGLNDALGNYSLTLIDSLSTLAILADGIAQFVLHYGDGRTGTPGGTGIRAAGFDLDSKVQVFETVIRGVGGLLSAHLFAIGELPIPGYVPRLYDGQLLRLALDLAQRLLPAFYTTTGIPYPRVNLRSGIPFYVNSPLHQASADEATRDLTLELTVLSRLTGDARFEQAAKRAFWEVWRRRSDIGLIGNGIDAEHGMWIGPHAGIGAGMDSFFEYALKSHILLSGHETPAPNASATRRGSSSASTSAGDNHWLDPGSLHGPLPPEMHSSDAFLEAWHEAHASVKRHLYTDRSHFPYYANSHRATGQPYTMWIDSLGAFYPGLLALAGEVDEAIEANLVYTALWTRYSALPERWSIRENNVEAGIAWWPGRPEFIESTYHIFRATRDPWYLHVGEMVLRDIGRRCHAPCGWAGLQDVRTGEKQDRMESFFLGETTKYMYLLFDPHHPFNSLDAAYVFTTEGHPLILPRQKQSTPPTTRRQRKRRHVSVYKQHDDGDGAGGNGGEGFTNTCPAPPRPPADSLAGSATAARPQLFGASRFTDLFNTPNVHGPIEAFEADGGEPGAPPVTRYRATSNHSLFPWTLPPSMLPARGTCAAPPTRVVSAIEFPARDAAAAAAALAAGLGGIASGALVWHPRAGPVVQVLEGLRLQLEREELVGAGAVAWRITHIGAMQLGRRETVFFHAEHVRHFRDEAFTCLRRRDAIEVELLVDVRSGEGNATTTAPLPDGTVLVSDPSPSCPPPPSLSNDNDDEDEAVASMPSESLLKHLLRAVSSVFDPSQTDLPATDKSAPRGATGTGTGASILSFYAHAPVGPGAAPLPHPGDTPVDGSPSFDARRPAANFPWSTVFLGGRACAAPLPDAAPRDHQLIVLRRGGCSFAQKLANVPAFTPSADALQLVVVVDDEADSAAAAAADDDDEQDAVSSRLDPTALDRPLLAAEQLAPDGSKRLNGVPMVLVRGHEGDYERFGRAVAAGMRNKYRLESQGLLIVNAVVI
ncbi:glycosyl hydrolase family 47 protein [Hirsutella rhossiliensis]|uniref:alpha-1,2-Mannosidase n=1 Tax=Hirsutella rhossiliensis TaxID=111463 RepID=A0A9P8N078_9HYPO|nr:glycosyl hydrolase family 47 protein [Hirsutella rhossiliensis]KAH0962352.1 glycosyl hydrolase family 47 protein [Hirsutella rhossiliensis]